MLTWFCPLLMAVDLKKEEGYSLVHVYLSFYKKLLS